MTPRPSQNRRTTNTRQRKKQQQNLLEVKIRASTERRRRLSAIFGMVFKVVLFSSIIIGGYIGGKEALRRFVWENPDYFIRDVKVSTDGTLTREQILKHAGIVEGTCIFYVELGKSKTAIEKMPQVDSAEVTRSLPNSLTVTVTERRPIAWLVSRADEDPTASEKSFLIDARGTVMKTKVKLEEYLHFPVISGVSIENLTDGERVTTTEMQAALELIQRTAESTKYQARHVDLSKGYCLVVTDHTRSKVTFGLDRIQEQLNRLHRYQERAAADMLEIQTVNLLVERNTPITFVPPPEPEPLDPEAGLGAPPKPETPKPTGVPAVSPKTNAVAPAKAAAPAATPVPRALPATTPRPASTPRATSTPKPNLLNTIFKPKPSPTPSSRDKNRTSTGVKKEPFRMR